MKEHDEARVLASRVLDRPHADPDDDLALLARQLLRADEKAARLAEEQRALENVLHKAKNITMTRATYSDSGPNAYIIGYYMTKEDFAELRDAVAAVERARGGK